MSMHGKMYRLQKQSMQPVSLIWRFPFQPLCPSQRIGVQHLRNCSVRGELRRTFGSIPISQKYRWPLFTRPPPPPFSRNNPKAQTAQSSAHTAVFVVGVFVSASVAVWLIQTQRLPQMSDQGWKRWDMKKDTESDWRNPEYFDDHFVCSLKNVREGRYYTLLTSTFMHQKWWHLGVNMLGLWSVGRTMALLCGIPNFLVLYCGGGIAGGLANLYTMRQREAYSEQHGGIGASGAILSLYTALACIIPKATVRIGFIPMPMMAGTAATVAVSVYALRENILPSIGHASHLGGMAFGALWWLVALRRGFVFR